MPLYNDMGQAYGLPRFESFAELTSELSADLPDDPKIDATSALDDRSIMDFVSLADADGNLREHGSDEAESDAVTAIRRTTLAARLKAIFADVDAVDAFTGMLSEPHIDGTEFGELQLTMWQQQFAALRDGDRFFYANDPLLEVITERFGIDYRRRLSDVIAAVVASPAPTPEVAEDAPAQAAEWGVEPTLGVEPRTCCLRNRSGAALG